MEIYRIVNRKTDKEVGVYMPPTARDEYNFSSISVARRSNCDGIYEDKVDYKIRKYKLVLVEDDCDPPTEDDYKKKEKEKILQEESSKMREKFALEKFGKSFKELSTEESSEIINCVFQSTFENLCNKLNSLVENKINDFT